MKLKRFTRNNDAFPTTFSGLLDDFFTNDFSRVPAFNNNKPSVNILEDDKSYGIEVAAPGFNKDEFSLDIDGDLLTISGKKEVENKEEEKGYTRREFSYESFSRSFNLPETVNVDDIQANYKDGILNIVLPKKEEATVEKKTIKVS